MYRDWLNYLRGCGVRIIMPGYSFDCILVDPSVIDVTRVTGIWLDGIWMVKIGVA